MAQWTDLAPGAPVLRWAARGPEARHFPGTARAMPDRVDYRFVNGFTETGPLPCREALLAEVPGRTVPRPEGPFPDLVLGLDGGEIDFSTFCFRPTLIVRAFRCLIRGAGPARFRLATCGGVRLWLDDAEAGVFEPFTRNSPQAAEVTLDLGPRPASLTLRLEDLHERDTVCFFSLALLEGAGVATALPEGFDAEAVEAAAATMASLRTDQVFYESGPVRLVADAAPPVPLPVAVEDLAPFGRGGLVADPEARNPAEVVLGPDAPEAVIVEAAEAPPGCVALPLEARVGGARIVRRLGTTILPPGHDLTGDLAARKARAA
jgi:hypothetical protein